MSTEPAPVPVHFPAPAAVKARLRKRVELPEYLPARMLNEFVYCPRLFFYEWGNAHARGARRGCQRCHAFSGGQECRSRRQRRGVELDNRRCVLHRCWSDNQRLCEWWCRPQSFAS